MKSSALLSMSLFMAHIAHPFVTFVYLASPSASQLPPPTASWPSFFSSSVLGVDQPFKSLSNRASALPDLERRPHVSSEKHDAGYGGGNVLAPLRPLTQNELKRMRLLAEYANVPYCASRRQIEHWSCGKCGSNLPNTTVQQVIEAQGTLTYITESTSEDLLPVSRTKSKRPLRHLLVVVRGTFSWQNLVQDFNYPLRPWRYALPTPLATAAKASCAPPVLATAGFMITYDAIRDQLHHALRRWIQDVPTDQEYLITFTGHSLGGAVATYAAVDLAASLAADPIPNFRSGSIGLTTFYAPRVGNQAFTDMLDSLTLEVVERVTGHDDINAHVPIDWAGYAHLSGGEKYVMGDAIYHCEGRRDPRCSAKDWAGTWEWVAMLARMPHVHSRFVGAGMFFGPLLWGGCLW